MAAGATAVTSKSGQLTTARVPKYLFSASALGEIAVGTAALVHPQAVAFLLATTLDQNGILLARIVGSAVLALGITWWIARDQPVNRLWAHYLAGYLVYNLGVSLLFLARALSAEAPAVPWVVAIVHVLAAGGFATAVKLKLLGDRGQVPAG